MNFKLVVFDMAGTTVADNGNVNNAFVAACSHAGYPVPKQEVNAVMGYRKKDAIRILLSEFYPEQRDNTQLIDEIHFLFTTAMVHFYETDAELKPLPYAEEVFEFLQSNGIKVALNTGFTAVITHTILNKLNWQNNPLINFAISSDEVLEGRPQPFMIQKIAQHLSITNYSSIVKVGDTEVDILEGKNAGCGKVIAVTTGAYKKEQLLSFHPDAIIDTLKDLPALLNLVS